MNFRKTMTLNITGNMKQDIVFLLYHDIDTEICPSEKKETATLNTVVAFDDFYHHMRCLYDRGYCVISVEKYFDCKKNESFSEKTVVLTFDDGHISNYDLAFPVLKKFGFTATFYIVAERIGKPWHMDRFQLRELVENGMEIGSHGLTHAYLPLLNNNDVNAELIKSKCILEKCLSRKISGFAYPGGHYTRSIVKSVQKAGYLNAASCLLGTNRISVSDDFLLKRVEIRRGVIEKDFLNALKPSFIGFYSAIDFMRRSFKHTVGLETYGYLRKKLYKAYPFKR